ncbi:SNARE-like superfamily protein isoform X1 [Carex rostrata]
MGIRFVLFVNKQGQTRLAQYFEHLSIDERRALEGEIVRKCLARNDQQCSFVEHRNYKTVYRRYASLFFLVGVDNDENELAILEFIHLLVETMDRHFGNVCELDIMFHLEKVHFMLEEMVMNGCIVETSKTNILPNSAHGKGFLIYHYLVNTFFFPFMQLVVFWIVEIC